MNKRPRSRPGTPARSRRHAGLPWDWRPFPVIISRSRSRPSAPAAPQATPSPVLAPAPATAGAAITPAPVAPPDFDPSSITLNQILDSFFRLPDPHSRVFAGLFETTLTAADPATQGKSWLAPVVSGAAIPGSRISVTFSDDLGITQSKITVHSDLNGHWIATRPEGNPLSETQRVSLEITHPLWSGETKPECFYISFPSEELIGQKAGGSGRPAGLLGVVLAPERLSTGGPATAPVTW